MTTQLDTLDTAGSAAPVKVQSASHGRLRMVVVSSLIGAGVIALVVWQRHRLSDLPGVLEDANWAWIAAAIVFQAASVASLAHLQRRLLNVDGLHHPFRPILATTYAGNAISQSLPVVGSAASWVFAYRRFLTFGADKIVAAWTLAVSGLYSTLAFVTLSAAGALITGSIGGAIAGFVTLLGGVIPAVLVLFSLQRARVRSRAVRVLGHLLSFSRRLIRRPVDDPFTVAENTINRVAELHLSRRDAVMAGRFALLNWTFDVACLVCAMLAIDAPIPWHGLLLAWAAGAGASSLGLTPGGLGVVEATLSVALIAAGLPAGLAVSAVLLYRFIKLWLVLAAGAITLLVIRSRSAHSDARTAAGLAMVEPTPA